VTAAVEPAPAGRRHGVFHPLRVEHVERLTDDAVAVTFRVPPERRAEYAFVQGQHVTIRAQLDGVEVRRSYSICAPVGGPLRVAVRRLDGGEFSRYATERLRPGDVLDVMTPTGRFFTSLDPAGRRSYCAVAAGSGITPVLSLVATTLAAEPGSTFTLVYGNRTSRSVMFLDELADLKDRYLTRFQLLHVLSREPQETELLSGRIDGPRLRRLLGTVVPAGSVDEWFLCGPFEMVQEARATLLDAGVDPARVHLELFHVAGEGPRPTARAVAERPGAGVSTARVCLDGRVCTVPVERAGRPILDAVLAVRPDAPYACRGGVCGTCRARLVAGEVRMDRNYALDPAEVEGGFVLACQSHPVSAEVVLDFDA
jgi:ring-1,2-phenylacetyl-CoA epoxidase subunit PaaE